MTRHDWRDIGAIFVRCEFERRNRPHVCRQCGKRLTRRYVSHKRGWQVPKTWNDPCPGRCVGDSRA